MKVQVLQEQIGKNFDLLQAISPSASSIVFKKIGIQITENELSKRWVSVNNQDIQLLSEEVLELEDIEISQLSLSSFVEGNIHITLFYIFN